MNESPPTPRTICCNQTKLDIGLYIVYAREDVERKRGWVWDHKGMNKMIPPDDLAEMLRLYENATANKDSRIRIPDRCRYFYWGIKTTWKKPARSRPRS